MGSFENIQNLQFRAFLLALVTGFLYKFKHNFSKRFWMYSQRQLTYTRITKLLFVLKTQQLVFRNFVHSMCIHSLRKKIKNNLQADYGLILYVTVTYLNCLTIQIIKQSSCSSYRPEYPKLIILSEGQERVTFEVCGAELQRGQA